MKAKAGIILSGVLALLVVAAYLCHLYGVRHPPSHWRETQPPVTWDFSKSVDPVSIGWQRLYGDVPPSFLIDGPRQIRIVLPNGRSLDTMAAGAQAFQSNGKVDCVRVFFLPTDAESVSRQTKQLLSDWQLPDRPAIQHKMSLAEWHDRHVGIINGRPDPQPYGWDGVDRVGADGVDVAVEINGYGDPPWGAIWGAAWGEGRKPAKPKGEIDP